MSATNRGAVRNESDFYPTPLSAFKPLLPYLDSNYHHWEPAQGDGRLVRAMNAVNKFAEGNDLNAGYNFLEDFQRRDCIITNPPFTLALAFCSHAIGLATEVFMLLRLNFLGSQKRREWWRQHEPSALFVLSERPSFTGGGTDATDYAWFYWGERYHGIFHL